MENMPGIRARFLYFFARSVYKCIIKLKEDGHEYQILRARVF